MFPLLPKQPSSPLQSCGLRETAPDNDGLFSGQLIPPDQSAVLLYTSWIALISAIYAMSRGHFDLCWVPWGVLLTSLNYWRRPRRDWRRVLDIAFVQVGLCWQLWRSVGAENCHAYWALTGAGIAIYFLGLFYEHRVRQLWPSTLLHGLLHVVGNVANIVLYSGTVPPLPRF